MAKQFDAKKDERFRWGDLEVRAMEDGGLEVRGMNGPIVLMPIVSNVVRIERVE